MKVFCNLALSLDGKIADRHVPSHALGTELDRQTMQKIRRKCDVIVVGANTLRASQKSMRIKAKRGEFIRQPVNAVITASGNLDPSYPFWQDPEVTRFVFTTKRGFSRAQDVAQERAFVVCAGEERVEPARVLERLKASGLKKVLVEGGGELVAEFLSQKLMHELYVTLTPWLLGGRENPSFVGGDGLKPWTALKLLKVLRVKDEFYLHYKVKDAQRV